MIFALQYWRELIMAILTVILAFALSYYPNRVKALEGERNEFKMALEFQNETLLKEAEEYERRLKELPKEIEKITTRYEVVYSGIGNFKKDENETDCNASYRFLSTHNY